LNSSPAASTIRLKMSLAERRLRFEAGERFFDFICVEAADA
jgi:hypothetical protein